jgi:O-acetyl-ADP-ribose deacetylase (regulator of RNase III)
MSFQILNKVAEEGSYTIHIPRIGAGLGGGDWGVIETIINHRCKNVNVIVWDLP